jgi:phosphoglycerate dehydrogenase-like enzyme
VARPVQSPRSRGSEARTRGPEARSLSREGRSSALEVLVTWPDYEAAGSGAALAAAGLDVRLEPKRGSRSTEQMCELVGNAVAAIVSTDPFDARVLAAARSLRVIARVGVGVDSIDLDAATEHGVLVTTTPGVNEVTVADHTIALMLATLRRLTEHDGGVRRGEWNRTGSHTPWLLSGATVGLIGFGQIGHRVAERLRGFGVRILVSDPVHTRMKGVERVDLDALLRASTIVSLHTPLSPGTRNLIGPRELGLMRPDSVLVNTARGGIVDEVALAEALASGSLRAAALDVFTDEPPVASPLLELPNVILSPHNAGLSVESIAAMTAAATESVVDVMAGRTPKHVANTAVLTRLGANHTSPAGGGHV